MSPPIAIIAALPVEARCFTAQKLSVGQTVLLKNNILLHVGGMGAERARTAALHLLGRGAGALVSWGTAGGLAPAARAGQLILPDQIVDQRDNLFYVDDEWRNQLHAGLAITAPLGDNILLQSDQIVTSVADKQRLFTQYRAVAVDMESAAIAAAAQQAGARFIAVRTIVDTADCIFPDWLQQSLNSTGTVKLLSLLGKLCRSPRRLRPLIHLARNFAATHKTLRRTGHLFGGLT